MAVKGTIFFFFFFFMISFILHRLESRTRPILTPYDGRRRWDSNLRTSACKSPALPLCYGQIALSLVIHYVCHIGTSAFSAISFGLGLGASGL